MAKYIKQFFFFTCILMIVASCSSCSHSDTLSSVNLAYPGDSIQQNLGDSVLTIVNWNIEWFGSNDEGPTNNDLQQSNALKVLRYLNADIYGLCEIVDTSRLEKMADSLGSDYGFVVSHYASSATSTTSQYYADAQKLAFVYKKSVFTNVSVRPYMEKSPTAGYYFATGRYPYCFNANVTKNGITKNITFLLIHAKSGSDETSYYRRFNGSTELKDSLDHQGYNQKDMMILGDLNDELQGTITTTQNVSPYQNFMQDNNYAGITQFLQQGNAQSTIDYPSIIDHQIISAAFDKIYVPGSAKIRTDVTSVIPDYTKGATSDHYPVSSQFIFSKTTPGN